MIELHIMAKSRVYLKISRNAALISAIYCMTVASPSGWAQNTHQNEPSQAVEAPPSTTQQVIVFKPANSVKSVSIAGTFNSWDRTANPLKADADGKTWRTTLTLPFGKYLYKLVIDGDTWIQDPQASKSEDDGNGNTNSVVFLAPPDYALPASPLDGVTAESALLHTTSLPYLNYDRGQVTISLRTRANDLKEVRLKLGGHRYPMSLVDSDELYARYQVQIPWNRKRDLIYDFELVDGSKTEEFGANRFSEKAAEPFHLKAKEFKPFVTPDWVERSVIYQIFPDRFANGDKRNDPPDVQPWNSKPSGGSWFGGDAAGVSRHLPYLSDLGISTVYFTPVFKSPSNHRYDAEDYMTVDPRFGTNAEFAALTRQMKSRGIRTVMDFAFNHTATGFPQFADVVKNGKASPYKDWYFIKSFPVLMQYPPNYQSFSGAWQMPKLNVVNPQTQDFLLGVAGYWKKEVPLAGLRFDVADEVDMRLWRSMREYVKKIDPQTWIVGETWGNASAWLTGDQWDAAMNYPFLFANAEFFANGKTSASDYTKRLMQIYNWYPPQVSRNMMNMLSTHDTTRFLTQCHGDQDLLRLAATVQFTWVGAPSIYYGDEIGMEGARDPDNRRGMDWSMVRRDNPMLTYYKQLIKLRNSSRVLQSGDPAILLADDQARTFAYSRTFDNQLAVIAINRSDKPQTVQIHLPDNSAVQSAHKMGLLDGLSGRQISLDTGNSFSITLPALRAAILLPPAK